MPALDNMTEVEKPGLLDLEKELTCSVRYPHSHACLYVLLLFLNTNVRQCSDMHRSSLPAPHPS